MTPTKLRRRWLQGALSTATILPLLLGALAPVASALDELDATPATVEDAIPVPVEPVAPPTDAAPVAQAAVPAPEATGEPQSGPTVRIDVPPPVPNESWYDDTVRVTISASSRIGSVESITWSTSGAQTSGATVAGGSASVTIDAQGSTRVVASAIDSEGNGSEQVDVLIKIDRTPPTMVVTAPAPGAHRFGSPIYIDYVCADPESGIDRTNIDQCMVQFSLDGVLRGGAQTDSTWMPREEGLYEVTAWAVNNSGLKTEVVVGALRVIADEAEAPVVTVDAPTLPGSGWYAGPVPVRIVASDAGAGVEYIEYRTGAPGAWGAWGDWVRVAAASATALVSATGVHRYQMRAVDYFGNASAITERTFSVDVTAPSVAVEGPADGIRIAQDADLTADYSCTDAGSGLESCDGSVLPGGRLDTSEAGTFTWSATAIDVAGNVTRVERSYTVFVPDTAPPTVAVEAPPVPASGWYLTPPSIVLTASDPSGVEELRWTMTGSMGQYSSGSESSGTWVVDDFMDGLSTITYYAIDTLGNEGPLQTLHVRVDRDAPWIVIDSPASHVSLTSDEDFEQGEVVDFAFRCDDFASGVESCVSSSGDVLPTEVVGTHRVTVTAVDRAGHRQVETLDYTVVAAPQPQPQPNGEVTPTGGVRGLAATGVDGAAMLLIALAMLAAGAIVTATAVRRRREAD